MNINKIFSIKYENNKKIIQIFGIKISFNKKLDYENNFLLEKTLSELADLRLYCEINDNLTAPEIVQSLVDKDYVRMPIEVDDEMAKEIYHLNLDDVENYSIAETGISPGPGLIIVVKAKEGKVDEVKNSLEQVLQDKINNAWYPEEEEIAKNSVVNVDGNYVSLFILNEYVRSDAFNLYNSKLEK